MTYTSKKKPALFLATEVTAVLGKTTSQKEFHPRPAVGLFSRVCSTNPLAEYPYPVMILFSKEQPSALVPHLRCGFPVSIFFHTP